MVRIGGLQKVSMIDYPGLLSAVIFLSGCNFRCPYCHNPGLARGESDPQIGAAEVLAYLDARRGLLEGVVISGGEPTLQPGLPAFCRALKERGYAVKLDTNGSFPDVIETLVADGLVDYVAMDVKTDPDRYTPALCPQDPGSAIKDSIRQIMTSGLPHEFRTTCFRPMIDPDTLGRIAALIRGAQTFAIQKFCAKGTLDPEAGSSSDHFFDDDELLHLKALVEPMVDFCFVR